MYERQRSSAFIQLAPRRASRTSGGLNTHQVDVHRADVRDEEVSNSARSGRRSDGTVMEFADPETLHLAHRRGANSGGDVEQNDIVESADPQTIVPQTHQDLLLILALFENCSIQLWLLTCISLKLK